MTRMLKEDGTPMTYEELIHWFPPNMPCPQLRSDLSPRQVRIFTKLLGTTFALLGLVGLSSLL